jgi:hypothetical protein
MVKNSAFVNNYIYLKINNFILIYNLECDKSCDKCSGPGNTSCTSCNEKDHNRVDYS